MELFSLKNKTAVVTGALGLIGKKHCEALAQAGASVIVADIDGKLWQSNLPEALARSTAALKLMLPASVLLKKPAIKLLPATVLLMYW